MDEPVNTRRFEGARLQAAAFPDDTGEQSPEVAAALAAYAAVTGAHAAALAALSTSRLLVPVVALLGEVEHDERGLAHDKSSDMAAVLLTMVALATVALAVSLALLLVVTQRLRWRSP